MTIKYKRDYFLIAKWITYNSQTKGICREISIEFDPKKSANGT